MAVAAVSSIPPLILPESPEHEPLRSLVSLFLALPDQSDAFRCQHQGEISRIYTELNERTKRESLSFDTAAKVHLAAMDLGLAIKRSTLIRTIEPPTILTNALKLPNTIACNSDAAFQVFDALVHGEPLDKLL
ncbi:MAG: hypothetical protein KC931_25470, partial [Candidatus Omnitrophica bacterium]|nr:hypothetical protein [Candidatus Omnitrophota bacterium]